MLSRMWVWSWTKISQLYVYNSDSGHAYWTSRNYSCGLLSLLLMSYPHYLSGVAGRPRPAIQPPKTWWRLNSIWYDGGSQPWLHITISAWVPPFRFHWSGVGPGFLKIPKVTDTIVHPRMRMTVLREKESRFRVPFFQSAQQLASSHTSVEAH